MINFPCPSTYELVTTTKQLRKWATKLAACREFSLDTETSSIDSLTCELRGLSLGVLNDLGDPEACYIPVAHLTDRPQLTIKTVLDALRPFTADKTKRTVFHHAVYDLIVLRRHGLPELENVHDTMFMSYTLTTAQDVQGHGMDHLCRKYFDYDTIRITDVMNEALGHEEFGHVGLEEATAYAGEDSAVTIAMFSHFRRELKEQGLWELYANEDRKLVPVFADMRQAGTKIDTEFLFGLTQKWQAAQRKASRKVAKIAGKDVNLSSPKALSAYLFDELKLPSHIETDSGGESSGKEALELIEGEHPVIKHILEVKKLEKLCSTFGAPLIARADEQQLIHTSFNPTVTKTGRLSSSDPNLQNIPIRTKEGREIRNAFVARAPDRVIISADYSQVEVRILAHLTRDPTLIGAFERGEDAHATTAAAIWGKQPEYYLDKENQDAAFKRLAAKTITFGLIYGMTEWGLARKLRIDPIQAEEFIERYYERMPTVQPWKESVISFAKDNKYSETLFGRRIHVPRINWGGGVGSGEERLAVNGPIQGSSADVTRRAMRRLPPALRKAGMDCTMVLQVHDELVFDCYAPHAKNSAKVIKRVMETCADDVIDWQVPIVVEVGAGNSWGEAH